MELGSDPSPYFPSYTGSVQAAPVPTYCVQLQYHNLKYIAFITTLDPNDVDVYVQFQLHELQI